MEKIYSVEFMTYTNCMKDTVSDGSEDIANIRYIHVGKEPFLIGESQLEAYSKFGGGYRSITFVGNMPA